MLDVLSLVCLLVAVLVLGTAAGAAVPPLPESLEPLPIIADIPFAEGPICDAVGNLYFVNYHALGTIGRRTPDGTVTVWAHTGGQANGLKIDAAGDLIVADYGAKRITRLHHDTRAVEVLTDHYQGQPYLGTNDVCQDRAGNIYFSDPTGSNQQNPIGSVYRIAMEKGKVKGVTRVAGGLAFPNGLAVSPDQKRLYVAESETNRLLCWDLSPEGVATNQRVVIQFPNATLDGLMFDEAGRLWIARWTNKTIDVVDVEKGVLLKSYPAGGDQVTNLCWWGTSLYVTVAGQRSIHRFETGVRSADIVPAR